MASPFKFFRKYSGGMMIVMVILSMLLFTLTDLFSDPGRNLWLFGLLIGGTVFAVAGIGQGRWLQWGLGGAVLGVLLGLILPEFVQGNGMLDSSLGVITQEDMTDLQIRRRVANQFVVGAFESSYGEGTGRFATMFGFNHPGIEDVLFGKLLRAEADELGITVSPAMVGDYLKKLTSDKLTDEAYVDIRNKLTYNGQELTNDTLQEILAEEIKARMAYQTLTTRTATLPPGPEVYWQYYRRLNVRQQIVTAALEVDDFIDQVPEPSSGEVEVLFAECKKRFPNQPEPGSPGFRLPFRAQLAYLDLSSKSLEAELPEVSDEDIQKYYDEKKETPMIRTRVLPDFPRTDDEKKADDEKAEEKKDDKAAGEKTAEEKKPKGKPAEDKAGKKKPAEKKAAKKKPARDERETAKPAAKKADADKTPVKSEEVEKKDADKSGPAGEASEKVKEAVEAAAEEAAEVVEEVDSTQIEVAPVEGEDESDTPENAQTLTVPDEEPDAEAKPVDAAPAKNAEEKKKKPAADEKPTPSLNIPNIPAAGADSSPTETPEVKYEYRELDDELKQEIREELTRQRVAEAVQVKLAAAKKMMETLSSDRASHRFTLIEDEPTKYSYDNRNQQEALKELRETMQDYDSELDAKVKVYAAKNGFSYVETPLLNDMELYNSEEYLIGKATEPVVNPMMSQQSPSVASILYRSFSNEEQNNDAQMYFVRQAERASASADGTMSHYVYWATDFSLSHVPELDEPGVREAVVREIKRRAAREVVQKRGEEACSIDSRWSR